MVETTPQTLTCPRCQRALSPVHNRRAVIDRCADCNGTFFDQGEMIRLLGESADPRYWMMAATSKESGLSEIDCPRCADAMALRTLAHESLRVEIDHCGRCGGLWLDGGEVDTVMQIGARQLARDRAGSPAAASPPEPSTTLPEPSTTPPKKVPTAAQTQAAMAIFNFMTSAADDNSE